MSGSSEGGFGPPFTDVGSEREGSHRPGARPPRLDERSEQERVSPLGGHPARSFPPCGREHGRYARALSPPALPRPRSPCGGVGGSLGASSGRRCAPSAALPARPPRPVSALSAAALARRSGRRSPPSLAPAGARRRVGGGQCSPPLRPPLGPGAWPPPRPGRASLVALPLPRARPCAPGPLRGPPLPPWGRGPVSAATRRLAPGCPPAAALWALPSLLPRRGWPPCGGLFAPPRLERAGHIVKGENRKPLRCNGFYLLTACDVPKGEIPKWKVTTT